MLTVLVWKELRELAPMIALALVVQLFLICSAMGMKLGLNVDQRGPIPFVSTTSLESQIPLVAGIFAILAGLWQTWWESSRGTFLFLLHRPIERRYLFAAKVFVGAAVCLLVSSLPTLLFALWAAAPGTHASPFDWSMTAPAWRVCLAAPVLYFGAFLSGLRPARWFGSRLFPLAAAILIIVWQTATTESIDFDLPRVLVGLAADAFFVCVILFVAATRDYS